MSLKPIPLALGAAALAINAFVGGLMYVGLMEERAAQEREVTSNVANLAEILDAAITGVVGNIDLSLRVICDRLEDRARKGQPPGTAEIDALLKERETWLAIPVTFRATDPDGLVRYGAGETGGQGVSYGDREFFRHQRDTPGHGLDVSDPMLGRISRSWLVAFSRRFDRPDGSFGGVVTASVPVSYFADLLSRLDVGAHGVALIRDSQGRLLARWPPNESPNAQVGATAFSPELAAIIASGVKAQTFHPLRTATGGERINAYRRLSNVPFHMVVGQGPEDYLSGWRADALKRAAMFAVFAVISTISLALLGRAIGLMQTAQERSRLLLRHASDGIHILDRTGTITEASVSFARMLGYDPDEVIGKSIADIDESFSLDSALKWLSQNGDTETLERRHRRKTGEFIVVEVSVRALTLLGQPLLFCSSRDITARKAAEENLKRANEDLEQFAYVSSHDLQTPLRNIVSYAQLLERRYKGRLDDDADQFIDFIVDSAKRLTRLLADLLAYSRASGRGASLSRVAAADAVATAVTTLRRDLDESGAEITIGPLPTIVADDLHLASLFLNLLQNALKYRAPDRPPRLAISAEYQGGGLWRFAVADNGIGIDAQYHEKIFEIFQRLDPVAYPDGTGVGLALCRRIVHRFGGTIWVESTPGQGSTFYFTLRDGGGAR